MTGDEVNPASLFRLYVDYGRYADATNLLLEYIESFASMVNYIPFFACQKTKEDLALRKCEGKFFCLPFFFAGSIIH